MKQISLKQRRLLLASVTLLFIALVIDGAFIEPYWPQVTRVQLSLPHLPPACAGLTIVQLSDIHFTTRMSPGLLKKIVSSTNNMHPDLIVLTGDYLTPMNWGTPQRAKAIAEMGRILGSLQSRYGVYAVLGNHDRPDIPVLRTAFAAQRITLLQNNAVAIQHHTGQVWLAGFDDAWLGNPLPEQTLHAIPAGACVIALVHEPDYAETLAKYPIDLQLSGHSHAGQLRLPFLGPLHTPTMSKKYPEGLSRIGHMLEYTNRGIGMSGPPLRINDRPEITLFTLRASSLSGNHGRSESK